MDSEANMNDSSAALLLNRVPDALYIEEWTTLLQTEHEPSEASSEISVVIFRLGEEWLALATHIFAEIADCRPIHSLPHRTNAIFLGVANLRGQLRLCVALHNLLDIEQPNKVKHTQIQTAYRRMISIQQKGQNWVFPVNEVHGILRCDNALLQNVPVTVAKSTANYLRGVIRWENRDVGYLDEELLLESLKRSVL